ncbi:hypothetical protein BJP36_42370 [Moorena producens JHB]|uniref:Uncharacterized protein n=1 Tax=Moorena producens (strain JHB) TaxID=1454205 RepID=A0A9Q9SSV2_MOOP1|nr:hypothetical protein [Moorena producens]WAN69012.1 hypothetical protein BJP36_42370 [Moorena producens JHB]
MRYTLFFASSLFPIYSYLLPVPCSRLDAVAHGGNHGSCSWGEPPRPHCLPKTALHRCSLKSRNCVPHKSYNCYITYYLLPKLKYI